MAILPRTLLTQPAPAAVAAVTLFGLTILGTTAHRTIKPERQTAIRHTACDELADTLGPQPSWSEYSWAQYAHCFESRNDARTAVAAAAEGLARYPYSEPLFNIKGYNEIAIGEYAAAADTLELGLQRVEPSNGVMENNLAWSYLYLGKGGTEEGRRLYRSSLDREPWVCETIHTGMFVEFAFARNAGESTIAGAEALTNFQTLRNRYVVCENRDAEWSTVIEGVGAAVLYSEMETMLDSPFRDAGAQDAMRGATRTLRRKYPSASARAICDEAMPLADLRDECVKGIDDANRLDQRLHPPCR
jgi:hypothetical protein